jgi:hypothetical protein
VIEEKILGSLGFEAKEGLGGVIDSSGGKSCGSRRLFSSMNIMHILAFRQIFFHLTGNGHYKNLALAGCPKDRLRLNEQKATALVRYQWFVRYAMLLTRRMTINIHGRYVSYLQGLTGICKVKRKSLSDDHIQKKSFCTLIGRPWTGVVHLRGEAVECLSTFRRSGFNERTRIVQFRLGSL